MNGERFKFEEELLKDSYSVKKWISYINSCPLPSNTSIRGCILESKGRWILYERSLSLLPRSYKLWKFYLDDRLENIFRLLQVYRDNPNERSADCIALLSQEFSNINDAYERSLKTMYNMPRIWIDYAIFLMRQRRITLTRLILDRALRALPFTQHDKIWNLYLKFSFSLESILPSLAAEIWSRYWRVAADRDDPKVAGRHLSSLMRCGFYEDTANLLIELAVNEPPTLRETRENVSVDDEGEELIMPGQYWRRLCDLISQHGNLIKEAPIDGAFRVAISKAIARSNFGNIQQRKDDDGPIHATGILWNALATWHLKNGRIEDARKIYNEAINNVPTVRDFSLVFDSFAKMEETLLSITLERQKQKKSRSIKRDMIDEGLAKFEELLESRPFLLSNVKIRQQPNNIKVWVERISLFKEKRPDQIVKVYEDALQTINPKKAKNGNLSEIWIKYASDSSDYESGRDVFRRAIEGEFSSVDELADIWIAFSEFERKRNGLQPSIDLLGEALVPPPKRLDTPKSLLFKNIKLWNYYLDLEEAAGYYDRVVSAYDRVIELGIATAQTIINYALFLESNGHIEESFKVYDRGIVAFGYPISFEIWNVYLPKYVKEYADKNIEKVRDLFGSSLKGCPSKFATQIYILYSQVEEKFGLPRNSLKILERATEVIPDEDKPLIFDLLLKKAKDLLGVTSQRSVFELAISSLRSVEEIARFSIRYADLETSLGEYERSRAIYSHAASDPRRQPELWSSWQEFESKFGSESTFRDMLRVKRSMMAKYSTSMAFVPAKLNQNEEEVPDQNEEEIKLD